MAQNFAQDIVVSLCEPDNGPINGWLIQSYTGVGGIAATQQALLYPSSSDASHEYAQMIAAVKGCQRASRRAQATFSTPRDANVYQIYGSVYGSAWVRSWTGVATAVSTRGPQTDLEYVAKAGRALTFLDLTLPGLDSPLLPSAGAANATLAALLRASQSYPTRP